MKTNDRTHAARLTPPGAGGVAVVRVAGRDAIALVAPHLQFNRPLNLQELRAHQLRLGRFLDDGEALDDVLVCARTDANGDAFVDLNLHGGPRIVERVLMVLARNGASVVDGSQLADATASVSLMERETLRLLAKARTRAVCAWMLQARDRLAGEVRRWVALLDRGEVAAVREALEAMLVPDPRVRSLLDGARIVVIGAPNAGKSTLVNALSDREQIIVSDVPGTTRDYVEQPAAIEGVPVTLVDTAGIRETSDALEREAIARTHEQIATADVLLHVVDATEPSMPEIPERVSSGSAPAIVVRNKTDAAGADNARPDSQSQTPCRISARTGAGLPVLRIRILEALHLTRWPEYAVSDPGPLRNHLEAAVSTLAAASPKPRDARSALMRLL